MPGGTLILICGLPGSGKTTFAKRLEVARMAIRFCPDEWIEQIVADPLDKSERDRLRDPVENLQWELAQSCLAKGVTVILENGFWAEEERDLYAVHALHLGAKIELYYVKAPLPDELWRRIELRNIALQNPTFVMTREELDGALDVFQPPTPDEMAFYDRFKIVPPA